jgi:hypothetical protein
MVKLGLTLLMNSENQLEFALAWICRNSMRFIFKMSLMALKSLSLSLSCTLSSFQVIFVDLVKTVDGAHLWSISQRLYSKLILDPNFHFDSKLILIVWKYLFIQSRSPTLGPAWIKLCSLYFFGFIPGCSQSSC